MKQQHNWFFATLQNLHVRHERLKSFVHEGMRYPLPKWGRFVMGCIYFSIPVIGGLTVMNWAISKAHVSIGEHGEKLPVKQVQGIGNYRVDEKGDKRKVGAGGWGAGVSLATSDEETQRRNREKLEKFLKYQERKAEKNRQQQALSVENSPTNNEPTTTR